MENVNFSVHDYLGIYIGKMHDFKTVSVFEIEVINCRMSTDIQIHLTLPNSFSKFRFENTVFDKISLLSEQYAGLASNVFYNCTFIKALYVDIKFFFDFKMLRSSINVPHEYEGGKCDVHLTGMDNDILMSNTKLSNILFNQIKEYSIVDIENLTFVGGFPSSFILDRRYSLVDIESSTFQGGHGPFFNVHQAPFRFFKTVFHIQSCRTSPENLIDFWGEHRSGLDIKDVLIILTSIDR